MAVWKDGASHAGRQWSERLCATLRREGRLLQGGWPGTMAEARSIIHAFVLASQRGQAAASCAQIESLARLAYASARQDWLSRADRGAPDRDD
jgi:hypothetical protein